MFCRMCNIDSKLTKHHLIPRCKDKNKLNATVDLCSNCHTFLHAVFSENYLKEHLNTLEKIMQHQQCQDYLHWRKKHPTFTTNSTKKSKKMKKI